MVGSYSSYLEFIGAVYFSMSLDEILTKRIWSPQDVKKQSQALYGLSMGADENFATAVISANKQKGEILQAELSKKSVIGLFVIGFLLIFCGYEDYVKTAGGEDALALLHLELAYTLTFFLASLFILQWVVFNKWKYTTIYIVGLLTFFIVDRSGTYVYGKSNLEGLIIANIGLYTCCAVTIPILWQIFITWIYKSVFYGFIKNKIVNAQKQYQEAQKNLENKNYDQLPREYYEIYIKKSQCTPDITAQQALDDSLTEYQGVLYHNIRLIGRNVKMYQLLISWGKHKFIALKNFLVNKKTEGFIKDKLPIKEYSVYAALYNTQKSQKKSLKMQKFCELNGLDFEEFNKYYCKYCQNKEVK